jgi:hypothetical protein
MADSIVPDGILTGHSRPENVVAAKALDGDDVRLRDCLCRNEKKVTLEDHTGLTPASTEQFPYPVDMAVETRASSITIQRELFVDIAGSDGTLTESARFGGATVGEGRHFICSQAVTRSYFAVSGPLTIQVSNHAQTQETRVDFHDTDDDGRKRVVIGLRSDFKLSPGEVTVPPEPRPLMEAISTFGPSLKMTTPQRSFPSLRTRPPELEIGDSLDLGGFEQADGETELAVPPTFPAVLPTVPLAFYTNAKVVPTCGDPVFRVADEEWELPAVGSGYADEVSRLLRAIAGLDTVARERSIYAFVTQDQASAEGARIARRTGRDFGQIAEQPLPERIVTYLSIPPELYVDDLPYIEGTYHVSDVEAGIRTLPNAAYRLATVRKAGRSEEQRGGAQHGKAESTGSLLRSTTHRSDSDPGGVAGPDTSQPSRGVEYCWVEETDARRQLLVSDGETVALNATTITPAAAQSAITPQPREGPLRIAAVCTDDRMDDELSIAERYRDRIQEVEVDVVQGATKSELREVLTAPYDYLHYIGHARPEGLRCTDGWLDTRSLEDTEVRIAVLNACHSLQQALGLVDAGAPAAIATRQRVENETAIGIGEDLAHLLSYGHTVQAAYQTVADINEAACQYVPLGAGIVSVTEKGTPQHSRIWEVGEDQYRVETRFPYRHRVSFGGQCCFVGEAGINHSPKLFGGDPKKFITDSSGVLGWTGDDEYPLIYDGKLWYLPDLCDELGWDTSVMDW